MYPEEIDQQEAEKQCINNYKDYDHDLYDIAAAFVEVFHWIMDCKISDDLICIFDRDNSA